MSVQIQCASLCVLVIYILNYDATKKKPIRLLHNLTKNDMYLCPDSQSIIHVFKYQGKISRHRYLKHL